MSRYMVLFTHKGEDPWGVISKRFKTLNRAKGWAKELAEFNARHGAKAGEYTISEVVPIETFKVEGGKA